MQKSGILQKNGLMQKCGILQTEQWSSVEKWYNVEKWYIVEKWSNVEKWYDVEKWSTVVQKSGLVQKSDLMQNVGGQLDDSLCHPPPPPPPPQKPYKGGWKIQNPFRKEIAFPDLILWVEKQKPHLLYGLALVVFTSRKVLLTFSPASPSLFHQFHSLLLAPGPFTHDCASTVQYSMTLQASHVFCPLLGRCHSDCSFECSVETQGESSRMEWSPIHITWMHFIPGELLKLPSEKT